MNEWWKLLKNNERNWKCQICTKYLSVFPIYQLPSDDKEFVCGRCLRRSNQGTRSLNIETSNSQTLFENIAGFLAFPCSYDVFGCKEELEVAKVVAHEGSCPFRNVKCPLNKIHQSLLSLEEVCDWKGSSDDLALHIKTYHKNYFREARQFSLHDNKTSFYFIEDGDYIFMVLFIYLQHVNKYLVPVYSTLNEIECRYFRYQLDVRTDSNFSVSYRKDWVETIPDQILEESFDKNDIILDVTYLNNFLKTDHFNVELLINRKIKKKTKTLKMKVPLNSGTVLSSNKYILDEEILHKIECMVCKDYMVPPIYLCKAGHSVCDSCTKMIQTCPSCRVEMTRIRNYQLEDLVESIDYHCRNKKLGCSVPVPLREFKRHEQNCEYTAKDCIIGCPWHGNNIQMLSHLRKEHELLDLDEVIIFNIRSQRRKFLKIVIYNGHIFEFVVIYGISFPFIFSLHCLSYHLKYKYEIHLLDKSENNLDMIVNNLCPMLDVTCEKYIDVIADDVKIPFKLIQHLIDDNSELSLKLTITNVKK
ncbi:uncharacterized protein LOC123672583 isoform X1 [Harmonia axyridis]|uniref:uncharacterized protein LOC123672583 isoform X1 n=1 Tax=Harmonia axyridis TaxID=115357 RepID=UPI001E275071|nr:uncharacterized protein LOC123672583 isoform X1 [Harmonia axyridis]